MKIDYVDKSFELNLTEKPDMDMVKLITKRFSEIDIPFTNQSHEKVKGKAAFKIWNKYLDSIESGIVYQSTVKNKPNRMYAKSASCQGLPSIIRNSLYRHATDTDSVACHPTIAESVCIKFELPHTLISGYLVNRDTIINSFMTKLDWSKKLAKQKINAIMMGGGIPMEVRQFPELYDWLLAYKSECNSLANFIKSNYPELYKDAIKRDKENPMFSALSLYLCNLENQIVLCAMEYLAQQGVKIYVYSFDGFLHSRWTGEYSDLNEYIFTQTGIPMKFISKPMEKFVEFNNVLELKEIESESGGLELDELEFKIGMTFDFQQIERFCSYYKTSFIDVEQKDIRMLQIRKYCNEFFTTIETEEYLIMQDFFHNVNGVRRRKYYQMNKYLNFKSNFCNDKTTIAGNHTGPLNIWTPCFDLWVHYFKWEQRNKKYKIDFYPSMEPQLFYNIFNGFHILPSQKKVNESNIKPFLDHIRIIWCKNNPIYFNYIIRWMAQVIQMPWIKTKCAIVLKGAEGCGKGIILSHFLGGIMGQINEDCGKFGAFRSVVKEDSVFGRFTNVLEGCCGLFLDELVWGGDKKASGRLKALITEDFVQIEHKGIGSYPIHSYINVAIASNEQWVIPASDNTRRFIVLECDNRYAGVQNEESKNYFDELLQVPIQDVADYLYSFDLTGFNSTEIPLTEELNEQKEMGMDSSYLWIKEMLSMGPLNSGKKDEIYHQYTDWSKETHQYRTLSNNIFWKHIQSFVLKEVLKRDHEIRYREIQFKEHLECIQVFKDQFKMDIKVLE